MEAMEAMDVDIMACEGGGGGAGACEYDWIAMAASAAIFVLNDEADGSDCPAKHVEQPAHPAHPAHPAQPEQPAQHRASGAITKTGGGAKNNEPAAPAAPASTSVVAVVPCKNREPSQGIQVSFATGGFGLHLSFGKHGVEVRRQLIAESSN
ncbi:hypothetical protein OAM67_00610 [bacterium]|nr:hypothetical protein [bacterium]